MNKKILVLGFLVLVATAFGGSTQAACLGTGSSCSENVTVTVDILPGDICIGTTGAFDFGDYTVSSSSQTHTGVFTDTFWVEDLKGDDVGYYTTLQLGGDMTGPGSATIPDDNVYVRVPNTTVTVIAGSSNPNVTIPAGLTTFSALNSPVNFLRRDTAANNGLIGKYGKIPEMQVIIPAYQSVGAYSATLVYTLYEN